MHNNVASVIAVDRGLNASVLRIGKLLGWRTTETTAFVTAVASTPWRRCRRVDVAVLRALETRAGACLNDPSASASR